MKLQEPFTYGSLQLENNIFYSPLAGCSNWPFRQMSSRYRPGLIYCEMVKMDALVRLDRDTLRLLDYSHNQHPIGAQLVGSKPHLAAECVEILQDMGFDAIDFNCGCPVDKVTNDGSGSGMLKQPQLIAQILQEMVKKARVPISVKIRAGWDEESINAPLICQLAQDAGAVAIAIHARTRMQAYKGPANWDYISQCRPFCKDILLIANGDIVDADSARACFEKTQSDALLVSRATMGGPWSALNIIHGLKGQSFEQNFSLTYTALKEHFQWAKIYLNKTKAVIEMRKLASWYLKPYTHLRELKQRLCKAKKLEEIEELLALLEERI